MDKVIIGIVGNVAPYTFVYHRNRRFIQNLNFTNAVKQGKELNKVSAFNHHFSKVQDIIHFHQEHWVAIKKKLIIEKTIINIV